MRSLRRRVPGLFLTRSTLVGLDFVDGQVTMILVSKRSTKPLERGSHLTCLRKVAAAGSLLDYWTDFGRLLT